MENIDNSGNLELLEKILSIKNKKDRAIKFFTNKAIIGMISFNYYCPKCGKVDCLESPLEIFCGEELGMFVVYRCNEVHNLGKDEYLIFRMINNRHFNKGYEYCSECGSIAIGDVLDNDEIIKCGIPDKLSKYTLEISKIFMCDNCKINKIYLRLTHQGEVLEYFSPIIVRIIDNYKSLVIDKNTIYKDINIVPSKNRLIKRKLLLNKDIPPINVRMYTDSKYDCQSVGKYNRFVDLILGDIGLKYYVSDKYYQGSSYIETIMPASDSSISENIYNCNTHGDRKYEISLRYIADKENAHLLSPDDNMDRGVIYYVTDSNIKYLILHGDPTEPIKKQFKNITKEIFPGRHYRLLHSIRIFDDEILIFPNIMYNAEQLSTLDDTINLLKRKYTTNNKVSQQCIEIISDKMKIRVNSYFNSNNYSGIAYYSSK